MPTRRWAALAVTVLITSMITVNPATAQADAPRPVRAVKRLLRAKHGVRVVETTRYFLDEWSKTFGNGVRIRGVLQLGPSGPVAVRFTWWDLPRKADSTAAKPDAHRVIRLGKDVYVGRDQYPGPVPAGKKWIRFPKNHLGAMNRDMAQDAGLQPINVYDPSMLTAVLKRSTSTRVSGGFLYRGTMSYRELSKISKNAIVSWTTGRPIGKKSKGTIAWRLWTDRTGLPTRLITTDTAGEGKKALVKRSDTRYTGWGFHLVVTAPPADEVIDEADLLAYVRRQNEPIPPDDKNT
ncbi:hypothetical protein TBS_18670 [Thermobispora bispora]|uniref:Sigma E regulatory protein, MucB/RseB n=1 Tax=Thermobispora bispora (strain ATCC 19993 / DSM 43833 / CBS 139.67 / JCM 10125 / KCTC 9307 / NBRC 14880 / R51) TaxID=469371 RepID=D6Y2P9_THEBD|nr:hypothetical protein [Thermobispora bispora]ADG86860.1 hypothetical protein Tbis_0127 [Thermobispora bispora DSM 43833]MBX6169370.1 hypothetical protein [Thermobispora bispora]